MDIKELKLLPCPFCGGTDIDESFMRGYDQGLSTRPIKAYIVDAGSCAWRGSMKITTEIEVTDCRDCPFKKDHSGHGECWTYCGHPDHGQGAYGDILWGCQEQFTRVPEWCPLGYFGQRG